MQAQLTPSLQAKIAFFHPHSCENLALILTENQSVHVPLRLVKAWLTLESFFWKLLSFSRVYGEIARFEAIFL